MEITITVLCVLIAAATLGVPIISIIIGRIKLGRALRPVEYYPPRGYSPIDVLIKYYGFRANTHEILNPIMLYWADRGFITIEEDCKRGLKLTKLRDIRSEDGKIADSDALLVINDFNEEKKLFDKIFSGGDVFYTLAAPPSYKMINKDFVSNCKANASEKKSKLSKKLTMISYLIAIFGAILTTILTVTASGSEGWMFGIMLFPLVGMVFIRAVPNEDMFAVIKYPFFAVWGGVPFCVALSLMPQWSAIPLGIGVISSALTISVFADRIDIRTYDDLIIYGRISAFKTFLIDAEADRINTLVEENPNYYYDVLPYCYILKITDKLKSKFDRIALDGPSWYLGDLRDTLMF